MTQKGRKLKTYDVEELSLVFELAEWFIIVHRVVEATAALLPVAKSMFKREQEHF